MRGRPPKPEAQRRTNVLRILLTEAERKSLDKASKLTGMEVSTWARAELLALARRNRAK